MSRSFSFRSSGCSWRSITARVAVKAIAGVALVVLQTAFTGEASAGLAGDFVYNNLNDQPYVQETGDRVNTGGRGLGDSFAAGANANLKTAVFRLIKANATTGDLASALFNVTGSSDANYAIGSQVGTVATIHVSDIPNLGIYTSVDLTGLNWSLVSGQKYAVGLYASTGWNNPDGSGGGIIWDRGAGVGAHLVAFNNWDVYYPAAWERWGQIPSGFSVGLATSTVSANVPEIDPATGSSALSLVAGVLAMIEQRRRRRGATAPLSA